MIFPFEKWLLALHGCDLVLIPMEFYVALFELFICPRQEAEKELDYWEGLGTESSPQIAVKHA